MADACRARSGGSRRALGPFRQRGSLPQRSGRARHRDLLGSSARGVGGTGRGADDDAPARRGRPPRRAPRPDGRALCRGARRDRDGSRPPEGRRRSRSGGVLPRRAGVRPHGPAGTPGGVPGAGGNHHHIGANSWDSAGAPPPPPSAAALRHATVVRADAAERDRILGRLAASGQHVRDHADGAVCENPSGNALVLAVAGGKHAGQSSSTSTSRASRLSPHTAQTTRA